MADRLAHIIQRYIAITSVGASTVRGLPKGTAEAAREFLAGVSLRQFGINSERLFRRRLNRLTDDFKGVLPSRRGHWGLARKLLNIFLHNALYNYYLRKKYSLGRSETLYEVPIDSVVARGIRRAFPAGRCPAWRGLKNLSNVEHEVYQDCAAELAASRGLARVHLDAILWVQER
jgi:hypothetical protein